MPDKRSLPLLFALSFVAVALVAPVASAAQHLRLGVQAGMNSWEENLSTPIPGVEDQTLSGDEAGLGVVAQWVIEAEADYWFLHRLRRGVGPGEHVRYHDGHGRCFLR